MKNIIEQSVESWVKQNSLEIAKNIIADEEKDLPIELLVFVSYLDKVKSKIMNALSSHCIDDIQVSINADKCEFDVCIFFDTNIYESKYNNCTHKSYNVDSIIEYLDKYLTSIRKASENLENNLSIKQVLEENK